MVSRCVIYFSLLSVVGYFYECLAMTVWAGKWENRGFLYGPAIPIYGTGALFGTILFEYVYRNYTPLSVFLISMFASAILEYVVHYALEKAFNAYWWDYSKAPFNINGRICLPASIGFGIAGLVIVYMINPILLPRLNSLNDEMAQFMALLCTSLFVADTTLTVSVITTFIKRIENIDNHINDTMDSFVGNFLDESKGINNHFYNTVDRVSEARKKLIDRRIDRAIDSMSSASRFVLNRVKGFKGTVHSMRMNEILGRIKNRVKIRKDER